MAGIFDVGNGLVGGGGGQRAHDGEDEEEELGLHGCELVGCLCKRLKYGVFE